MHDIETEADVKVLVDSFYQKVVRDDVIGYLFNDVVQLDWSLHIPIMNDFWGTILLDNGRYRRNPMVKHVNLDMLEPLRPEHFQRWLSLWEQTLNELFVGPMRDFALARAKQIAGVMERRIRELRALKAPEVFRFTE